MNKLIIIKIVFIIEVALKNDIATEKFRITFPMKRSFNSFYIIIFNKEKKELKFGSKKNFTPYYMLKKFFGTAYRFVM
ncbi:MAG: hypothetical protein U9O66_02970 [Patescibacteria group bacterium]|nr:hypothetical protein [Patescibacteria group bacterium]